MNKKQADKLGFSKFPSDWKVGDLLITPVGHVFQISETWWTSMESSLSYIKRENTVNTLGYYKKPQTPKEMSYCLKYLFTNRQEAFVKKLKEELEEDFKSIQE